MLRLAHHIRREIDGIRGVVRRDEDFARPGNHVNVDRAVEQPLGGGYIDVAGPTILSTRGTDAVP